MPLIWDYDINELKKTKSGRLLILERVIENMPKMLVPLKLADLQECS